MRAPTCFLAVTLLAAACGDDTPAGSGGSSASSSGATGAGTTGATSATGTSTASSSGAGAGGPGAGGSGGSDATSGTGGSGGAPTVEMAESVTQFGITWTFDGAYPVGRFANGDFWVVGPVTIAEVSPAPTDGRNGSVVNPPLGSQGYDERGGEYDGSVRAAFPLALPLANEGVSSIVSSISHGESDCMDGNNPAYTTYDGGCQRGPIQTQAVLTVLDAAPSEHVFRPPYAGADAKPLHPLASVRWDLLPSLPVPDSARPAEDVLRHVERPWIDHILNWTLQHGCATHNMYCYGREIGDVVSEVALHTLLDTPAREELTIRFIQLGIDNAGVVANGGSWPADGGHMNGRKWPIVFAGLMLDDAEMASPGPVSGEDGQTYFGAEGEALWGVACDSCFFENGCDLGGDCNAGRQDCRDPEELVDGCYGYRNCCTSHTWVGQALAARLVPGGIEAWDHEPLFAYVDRWMGGEVEDGGGTGTSFVADMWTAHR
jgi:hypothetical protein